MKKPTATKIEKLIGTAIRGTGKTIFLGNARICDLETQFDLPFRHVLEQVANNVDVRTIRTCLAHGLRKHHADEATTEHVDAIIDQVGVAAVAAAIVAEFNFSMGGAAARAKAA